MCNDGGTVVGGSVERFHSLGVGGGIAESPGAVIDGDGNGAVLLSCHGVRRCRPGGILDSRVAEGSIGTQGRTGGGPGIVQAVIFRIGGGDC